MNVIIEIIRTVVPVVATAIMGVYTAKAKKKMERETVETKALMLLLRRDLKCFHKYLIKKEYIRKHELEDFEETYNTYKALGGNRNGTMLKMYEEVRQIPFRKE